MGNTNNQECILEKSETLFLTPSYIPTSSQATQTRRAPCVPHDLPMSHLSQESRPHALIFLPILPHFLQETLWNNPPSPHWPLPPWPLARIISVALPWKGCCLIWPQINLSEFIWYTQPGCPRVETWFLNLTTHPAEGLLSTQSYSMHSTLPPIFKGKGEVPQQSSG